MRRLVVADSWEVTGEQHRLTRFSLGRLGCCTCGVGERQLVKCCKSGCMGSMHIVARCLTVALLLCVCCMQVSAGQCSSWQQP